MLKRAAVNIQAQASGHAALSVAIYHEKCVQDCIGKLLQAKKEAANSWMKWAKSEEENVPVRELFLKLAELDYLWIRTYRDYFKQYEAYRGYFKQILQGEKSVDECKKKVHEFTPKIEKLQKQINKIDAKYREKKLDELSIEYGKLVSLQQKAQRELEDRTLNNNVFKYKTVRDAVKDANEAERRLHERGYEISQTQHLLLDFYTATTYSSISPQIINAAKSNGNQLVADLESKLKLEDDESIKSPTIGDATANGTALDQEEVAEYCPIPEMDEADEAATTRPLPPLPPGKQINPSAPEYLDNDAIYRPSPTNPYYPAQQALHTIGQTSPDVTQAAPSVSGKRKPPVPPRHSAPNQTTDKETPYLEMVATYDMKRNTVYESGGTADDRVSYMHLSETYSDKQRSPVVHADDDDAIYDSVEDDQVHMRICDVTRRTSQDTSLYEL